MKKSKLYLTGILCSLLVFGFVFSSCAVSAPNAPVISGSYTATTTTIKWSAVSGATSYDVYYASISSMSSDSAYSKLKNTTSTSYVHTTDKKYAYRVKAVNSFGESGFSNTVYVP
jgi:fibronectin type 3 domain-containing protein